MPLQTLQLRSFFGDRAVARTAECSSGEQPVMSSRLARLTSPTRVFPQLFSGWWMPHKDGLQLSYLSAVFS
jgi:hypothetical protein